jgi:hypothetical protein
MDEQEERKKRGENKRERTQRNKIRMTERIQKEETNRKKGRKQCILFAKLTTTKHELVQRDKMTLTCRLSAYLADGGPGLVAVRTQFSRILSARVK